MGTETGLPQLLRAQEVITLLRLDDRPHPDQTLRHMVRTGRLKPFKLAGRLVFTRADVEGLISRLAAEAQERA